MNNSYDENVDYKEMYLHLLRASEEAIRILVSAQQKCEELYLSASQEEINQVGQQ